MGYEEKLFANRIVKSSIERTKEKKIGNIGMSSRSGELGTRHQGHMARASEHKRRMEQVRDYHQQRFDRVSFR